MSTAPDGLEDLLRKVAAFAVQAIPGADRAGLTLLQNDRADTIVASAPGAFGAERLPLQMGGGRRA